MLKDFIPEKKLKLLKANHIENTYQLLRVFPKKYSDYSKITTNLNVSLDGQIVVVSGRFVAGTFTTRPIKDKSKQVEGVEWLYYQKSSPLYQAQFMTLGKRKIYVSWIYNYDTALRASDMSDENKIVYICGTLKVIHGTAYAMTNPVIIESEEELGINVEYPKVKGIADKDIRLFIDTCLNNSLPDIIPKHILDEYHLMTYKDAVTNIHHPISSKDTQKAYLRLIVEELLYFSALIRLNSKNTYSRFVLNQTAFMEHLIKNLPYTLTQNQKDAIEQLVTVAREGRRINAFVEGDNGSGKSVIAIALLAAFCGNGYQVCIATPAPGKIYKKISGLFGSAFKIGYLSDAMSVDEKLDMYERILYNDIQCVVGTYTVLEPEVPYGNLALTIIDEGRLFADKSKKQFITANNNSHCIRFSEMPIPKVLAEGIFTESMQHIQIKEKHTKNKSMHTFVTATSDETTSEIQKAVKRGSQVLVICAKNHRPAKSTIHTIDRTHESLAYLFGERIGCVTSRTSKKKLFNTVSAFFSHWIDVLIMAPDTAIEIDRLQAEVLVIRNAETYGLSALHQIRSLVGRRVEESVCILECEDESQRQRLEIMCNETDGFEIAEKDFEMRGAGRIFMEFGSSEGQLGYNLYVDLLQKYPRLFSKAKKMAEDMDKLNELENFINAHERLNACEGEV